MAQSPNPNRACGVFVLSLVPLLLSLPYLLFCPQRTTALCTGPAEEVGFAPAVAMSPARASAGGDLPAALTSLLHQTDRTGRALTPAPQSPGSQVRGGAGTWGRPSPAIGVGAGAEAEPPTPLPTLAIDAAAATSGSGGDVSAAALVADAPIPAHRGVLMAPTPVVHRTASRVHVYHTAAAAAADGHSAWRPPAASSSTVSPPAPAPAPGPGWFRRIFCCSGGPVASEPERPPPLRSHASEKERIRHAAEQLSAAAAAAAAPGAAAAEAAAQGSVNRSTWLATTHAQNQAWREQALRGAAGGGSGGTSPSGRTRRVIWRRPLPPTERVNNVMRPASDVGQGPLLGPIFECDRGRKCLVLDLDETLVHSSFKPVANPHYILPVEIEGVIHSVYVMKRPGCDEFLQRVGRCYEVVIFTASLAKVRGCARASDREGGGG